MSWQIYGKIIKKIVTEQPCNDLLLLISHDRHFVAEKNTVSLICIS